MLSTDEWGRSRPAAQGGWAYLGPVGGGFAGLYSLCLVARWYGRWALGVRDHWILGDAPRWN